MAKGGISMKGNFSLSKLARNLDRIVMDNLNVIGNHINKSIQDGLDSGTSIKDKKHTRLSEDTTIPERERKGFPSGPPLVRTGTMRQTRIKKASLNNQVFEIRMAGKSKRTGQYYGAYHNQGYTNSPKSAYPNKRFPKREWFGIPQDAKEGGTRNKKMVTEIHRRVRTAFKSKFRKVGQYSG